MGLKTPINKRFHKFLASLALQPILVNVSYRVAQSMAHGMVAAYCGDVYISGRCSAARDAHAAECRLARDELGIEEDPTEGPGSVMIMWELQVKIKETDPL